MRKVRTLKPYVAYTTEEGAAWVFMLNFVITPKEPPAPVMAYRTPPHQQLERTQEDTVRYAVLTQKRLLSVPVEETVRIWPS